MIMIINFIIIIISLTTVARARNTDHRKRAQFDLQHTTVLAKYSLPRSVSSIQCITITDI